MWVKLQYSDGTKTNGIVAAEPLAQTEVGRELLRAYVISKNGKKISKYVTF